MTDVDRGDVPADAPEDEDEDEFPREGSRLIPTAAGAVPASAYTSWPSAGNSDNQQQEVLASHSSAGLDYADLLANAVRQANLRRTSMEVLLPPSDKMYKMAMGAGPAVGKSELDASEFTKVNVQRLHKRKEKAGRRMLVDTALATNEQDNLHLLTRVRQRMDRVGISQPRVEVRFEDLSVEAMVNIGTRGMPTVFNAARDVVESALTFARVLKTDRRPFTILQGVNGILRPGRLTLLLGPPGSGKTTLLKVLAGVIQPHHSGRGGVKVRGRVTYNGETFDQFQVRRTSAYIDQVDSLMAELTVRETLNFSAACQGSGYVPELVAELRKREREAGVVPEPDVDALLKAMSREGKRFNITTDLNMRVLGLDICADTPVGNNLMRGVSGGQKKRVTTGEMTVGPHKTLFMDEISTGLDSSTTFLITNCLRNFVHLNEATVLIALLQPPPEVFELFDDVMLLSEGHVVYHGVREQVVPFFASVGFSVPERKGTGDFLQEVTSRRDQEQYWNRPEPYKHKPVLELCRAFEAFPVGQANAAALALPYSPPKDQLIDPLMRTRYALDGWQNFKICLWRDWVLMTRHGFLYTFKIFQVTLMAFIMSTLFIKPRMHAGTTIDAGTLYLAVIFYSLVHLMFSGYAEMSLLCNQLPVFYKQRDMQFFPAWCFALPTLILRLPYSILDATIWSVMVYWSTGLAPSAGRFFIYLVYMVLIHQMALALFRFMGALGRKFEVANNYGSVALILVILLGGFVLTKSDIHPWSVWFFWVSPLMYPQQGLAINEMHDPRWQAPTVFRGETLSLGDAILTSRGMFTETYWIYCGILVLIGYSILFSVGTFVCLAYLPPPTSTTVMMTEEALLERELNRTGDGPTDKRSQKTLKKIASEVSLEPVSSRPASTGAGGNHTAHRAGNSTVGFPKSSSGGHLPSTGTSTSDGAGEDVEAPRQKGGKGMMLPFTPMAYAFRNICYRVDMPAGAEGYEELRAAGQSTPQLQLLTDITGTFRPGILTALVGVSGAGKTTLMDVLAGRKTSGVISGDMYVAGFPKVQEQFTRVCGYVEQTDIHSPRTTVREALAFSGLLRLFDVERSVVENFVDEVMDLVELAPLRDALVGYPGQFGLSVEQRKRLTIAVELVANPSVIFMDEPTSGLDARAAAIVMRAVRNTVNTGRTVVCTIHQPSIDIFEAFDDLLLLKRGGRIIYNGSIGERSQQLISYFCSIKGVSPIREGLNPATWVLEISSVGAEGKLGIDFAEYYAASALAKRNDALAAQLMQPAEGAQPIHFDREFARGWWTQLIELCKRDLRQYWRNPGYNAVRLAFCIALGFILGSIYWKLGRKRDEPKDVLNIMGALFICITFLGTSNASGIQPVVSVQRPVFYRERATFMYQVSPYFLSQGIAELPYILAQTIFYGAITYWMIDFEHNAAKFFWYLLFTYLTLVFFAFYGMMSVAISSMLELAAIMSSLFYSIWFLFAGFMIGYPAMPKWWFWFYWLDPLSYALYGIIGSQLGDVNSPLTLENGAVTTVRQYLLDGLGFKHSFIGWAAFILIGFICMFWLIVGFALKFINFNKR